jgi:hypothetical protein
MKLGTIQKWVADRQKDEVLLIGEPPRAAVRCTRRVIDEPVDPGLPDGKHQQRQIWYSHDVPVSGRVKMFPAQQGGERMAISWDKKLSEKTCAERAANYPMPPPEEKKPEPGMGEAGMGEAGMEEPGMADPGMTEPGMTDPEPGMDEPKKGDEPGK